jgi:hypothetical protein
MTWTPQKETHQIVDPGTAGNVPTKEHAAIGDRYSPGGVSAMAAISQGRLS